MDELALGLDLGGTKSAALVGTKSGEILHRVSAPTPAQKGAEVAVPFLLDLLREVRARVSKPIAGIGISAGAPCNAQTGRVFSAPNLPHWDTWQDEAQGAGVPLARIVSEAFGNLPTFLENDADATALAEHKWGAGQNAPDMAFLTVGTGIGSGLIISGELCRGSDNAGGEIGHVCVETHNGRLCLCGLRGCLEAYSSGPSIVRVAQENGWTGEATGQAVIAGARKNDKAALFAVTQAGEMLGRGLAILCMITNPRRIVLGTLAVHAGDLLLPLVWQSLRAHAWPRIVQNVEIVPAALGDKAQDLAALCAFWEGKRKSRTA